MNKAFRKYRITQSKRSYESFVFHREKKKPTKCLETLFKKMTDEKCPTLTRDLDIYLQEAKPTSG